MIERTVKHRRGINRRKFVILEENNDSTNVRVLINSEGN